MRVAVLASGRGSNLQALIDKWLEGFLPITFVGVGSDNVNAEALLRAQKVRIPVRVFPLDDYADKKNQEIDILNWLEDLDTELLVLAGYMRVLSKCLSAYYLSDNKYSSVFIPAFRFKCPKTSTGFGLRSVDVLFTLLMKADWPGILRRVPVYDGDDVVSLSKEF